MEQRIIYVGLDVHKDTIAVALAEAGKRGEVREHGKIANTPAALRTLAAKLASHGWRVRFCYEAGPCGYGIQRQLSEAGHECVVVAPSLIPRKPGDRVKTDDATRLTWPNCTERVNCRRCGFQTQPMRRSAIGCARDWRRCACCGRRAGNSPASCCAMAIIITGRPGP
jgi:hypothetical protein